MNQSKSLLSFLLSCLLFGLPTVVSHAQSATAKEVESVYPDAHALYLDLHQNPELSGHETQTAQKLAARLRSAGYDVTEHVGGTGVVAILKNGAGPTIMLRTELDALPVEEKTGTAICQQSAHQRRRRTRRCGDARLRARSAHGGDSGHGEIMARSKNTWHGTLMLIGQPAEETIGGAEAMIRDGLFTRFPKPDVAVALHVGNDLPAGMASITPGIYNTNADSIRITIYGKGGHGAACRRRPSIPS